MISKQIAKIEPRWHDHLLLIFKDGTQLMVARDEHREAGYSHQEEGLTAKTTTTLHHLKVGDWYPPLEAPVPSAADLDAVAEENQIALDTKTSSQVAIIGESAVIKTKDEDEVGAAQQPEDGARKEG